MKPRPTALILLCACSAPQEAMPPMPERPQLQLQTVSIRRYPDGSLKRARLAEPATIQGYRCVGAIEFGPDGRLRKFTLEEALIIDELRLPPRSRIVLDAEGRLQTVWLKYSTIIEGLRINGDAPFGLRTDFHSNGRLKRAYLANDTEIQGVLCKASKWTAVRFDEEGRLKGLMARTRVLQ